MNYKLISIRLHNANVDNFLVGLIGFKFSNPLQKMSSEYVNISKVDEIIDLSFNNKIEKHNQ
jgi:basic membrane lipoprotein Med (substrate-binding protein (PBP1-ABC) superfamily)